MTLEDFVSKFEGRARFLLREWSERYSVSIPKLLIAPDEELDKIYPFCPTPFYDSIREVIVFPLEYIELLYNDGYKKHMLDVVMNILEWSLAHEFSHHVRRKHGLDRKYLDILASKATVTNIGLPEKINRKLEFGANIFAREITGKSRTEETRELRRVTGMTRAGIKLYRYYQMLSRLREIR